MATICDIENIEYPETYKGNEITPLPGKSFAQTLNGDIKESLEPIFWEHFGNRAVREGDWKLVAREGEAWELYNLAHDRTEINNLIEGETEKADQLLQLYEEWAEKVGLK